MLIFKVTQNIIVSIPSDPLSDKSLMKIRALPEDVAARAEPLAEEADLELSTSMRYDPNLMALTRHIPIALQESHDEKFFLANLHYQRLKQGARLLKWQKVVDEFKQTQFNEALASVQGETPLAVRLAIKKDGSFSVTTREISARSNLFIGVAGKAGSSPVYDVYIDETKFSPFAPLKTNKREVYNKIRAQFSIEQDSPREVLVQNLDGNIMEATVCSVAILRGEKWVCPTLEDGGISSVMRSLLLDLEYIEEGEIKRSDLVSGQEVMLFNGVIGTVRGKVV